MICKECQDHLAAFADKILEKEQAEAVASHIEHCSACSALAEEYSALRARLLRNGEELGKHNLDSQVMSRIFREQTFKARRETRYRKAASILVLAAATMLLAFVGFFGSRLFKLGSVDESMNSEEAALVENTNYGPPKDDWLLDKRMDLPSSPQGSEIYALQPQGATGNPRVNGFLTGRKKLKPALRFEKPALKANTLTANTVQADPALDVRLRALGYADGAVGFSVGGAKDMGNFRENIAHGFLPIPTDVIYEGLFYDYFFDTGEDYTSEDLFYPSYSAARTRDPFSGKEEYYLTVGLNSGLKSFERKKLNLVIVLDVSGSMKTPFNEYHYDGQGSPEDADLEKTKPKIEVAKESLLALLDHLNADDRFGMVVFRDNGILAKPLRHVGGTDMESVRGHIQGIFADGATNMSSGMQLGSAEYDRLSKEELLGYENRIIFLTDAMPNRGELSEQGLLGMARKNAEKGIYSTFIGVGVDFNSELLESITKMRGASYLSVHSPGAFRKRMDEEFEYMVTPLVFGLELAFESGGYRIDKVFGSPEASEATGSLMKVKTLFPSKREGGETKGGVVLLKLSRKAEAADDEIFLSVKYEDRDGGKHTSSRTIRFGDFEVEHFQNTGIRKAVLLTRYASLLKDWLIHERIQEIASAALPPGRQDFIITEATGILLPPEVSPRLGQWERQSKPLTVSPEYRDLFTRFKVYLEGEKAAIGDNTLDREVEVLERLARQ